MKKYFRPEHQRQDKRGSKGPKSKMCDHQEKEYKHKKSTISKSQQEMLRHCNQERRRHHHQSRDDRQKVHSAEDIRDLYPNHRNQRDDKTRHHHPRHSHNKPNHRHVSVSESTSSSPSSSSTSSSSSSSSTSTSSSSSSFSSTSTSSSSSSLSSENSSESSYSCRPRRPQHSQSFSEISGKHTYFEEEDDTAPLINARRSSAKQKRDMRMSSLSCPTKEELTSKQIIKKHMGKDGSFHKARSMEDLPSDKDRRGIENGNGNEQEEDKSEARKNLLKEKMKFSAFLNEITRQVLSPMRLTSLGVTDAQRPLSPGQVSPRSRETDSSTDKPKQKRSRPASPDSVCSSKHSYTSKHSSRRSHSKSFHHQGHHSSSPQSHMKHRRRSYPSRSPTPEHYAHLSSSKHYNHHHHHCEDLNNPNHQHGHHHTTSHYHHHGHDHSPVCKHKSHHGPIYYSRDHNTSHPHGVKHHEDRFNPAHHHDEHQTASHCHDHPTHFHDYHHGVHHDHVHHCRDNYNSSHHHKGHHIVPHHRDECHSSDHHHSSRPNSRPTTPCHHEHHSPTSKCGDHQGPPHQHHHSDHHSEAHQHHHGDHHSEAHQQHHGNRWSGPPHLHHGDHHKEAHHHHDRDHQSQSYQQHSLHHQNKPNTQDHDSPGHTHLLEDHKREQCGHQHGDHNQDHHHHHEAQHNLGHYHHHGDHHSPSRYYHHGDHHSPGHLHGDQHSEAHHHHHGDHHSPGHLHGDQHTEAHHHHHGDHHSTGHHHHCGDQHREGHHHHHGDHHSPGHQHREAHHHQHGAHHSQGHQHSEAHHRHQGDHQSPSHHHLYENQYSEAYHHTDHHSPSHYQYHGDRDTEAHQHHHGDNHNPGHQHFYDGDYSETRHQQDHHTESQPHPSLGKNNNRDNKSRDDKRAISPPSPRKPETIVGKDSPRSSSQDEEQTSFTGSTSHEAKTHEPGRTMSLPDQNVGLHHSLLKTAVRMECLGEEFISSQKLLETELQSTRTELSNLMERFRRLQDDCSSTQQTNNLLEQKLHSMLQNMEGERERLNRRISELTEQLTDVKIANTMEEMNMTSVLHSPSLHYQSDDVLTQMALPIAPPPAQFMDSHNYGKDKSSGQEQPLGSVPEEEESDWSEVGDETHRLILIGSNRGQTWRQHEADMDKDSESGSEEFVRRHSPYPLQIPHLQFTIHNEFLPPAHTSSCPSGFKNLSGSVPDEENYRIATSPNIKSAILIRSASLEEIPLTRYHMQEELRGTSAMMNLHHSADEVTEDLNNEIFHHWRISNDRDTVIRRLTKGAGSEAESGMASLQSAERTLKRLMCDPPSRAGGELGRPELHGWAGGIPDEVLNVERTQL